jgi:hypothetical protein
LIRHLTFPLLALILAFLIFLGLGELGATLIFALRPGLSPIRLRKRLKASTNAQAGTRKLPPRLSLHPFFGYIPNPEHPQEGEPQPLNDLGFFGLDPRSSKAPDVFRVALTGGSVAKGQAQAGGPRLVAGLARLPRLEGKKIEIVCLALGGFKQPQQLHALVHGLSLGAKLDLVINLDGFNEVALPPVYNQPVGISPIYPRDWESLSAIEQPEVQEHQTRLASIHHWYTLGQGALAHLASQGSRLALLIFAAMDHQRTLRKAFTRARFLSRPRHQALPLGLRGPRPIASDLDSTLDQAVKVWAESSRLMQAVCLSRGIAYLHLLQPNQYDPATPAFTGPYRRLDSPMLPGAQAGYPRLRQAGEQLRSQGVAFVDLSGIFGNHGPTMYGDDCCHYSQEGIDTLTDAIIQGVATMPES